MTTKYVQAPEMTLQSSISAVAASCVLTGMVDLSGVPLVQTDFGDVGYGTFEPNTAREEAVSFVITSNPSGTATLTITRGLRGKAPYGTGGTGFIHNAGAKFVLSNNPDLLNKLTAKDNDETVSGSWSFPTPTLNANPATKLYTDQAVSALSASTTSALAGKVSTTGNENIAGIKTFSSSPVVPTPTSDLQAATKKYVDDTAVAGAPNAGETTKGLVEEATLEEIIAGTATGGTGAKLFAPTDKLISFLRGAIEVTTGTTHSLTTNGSQRVIVFVKGNVQHVLGAASAMSVRLNYDGVQKDISNVASDSDGTNGYDAFALMYTEVPASGTRDITVTIVNGGTLENVRIIVLKI